MGKEKAVKVSSTKNKDDSGAPVVVDKQMKRKKRKTDVVEFDAEVADIENMIPSSVDPSILVNVTVNYRVNLDKVVEGGVQSLINKWNEKGVEPKESNNEVLHAAEDVIVEDASSDEETETMVDDLNVNSSSQIRLEDIPLVFKAGSAPSKVATTVGGGGIAVTVEDDGGSSKAAKKTERRNGKAVGVSKGDGNASGQRVDNSKTKIQEGKMKGHMGDNSKAAVASKEVHAANNSKMNFAGIFKENRVAGNGFELLHYDTMEDDVVLDESDEIPVD